MEYKEWGKDGQKRCLKVLRDAILMPELRVAPPLISFGLSAIVQVSGKCVRAGNPESNPSIPMLFLTKFTGMPMFESSNVSTY